MSKAAHASKTRILVVEDEVSLRDFFVLDLTGAGFMVTTASDGAEAIALLATEDFDAVVTDLNLPKKSGVDIVQDLRAHRNKDHPVIAVITGSHAVDRPLAHHLGVNLFLEKPFKRQSLTEEIKRLTLPNEIRWLREHTEPFTTPAPVSGHLDLSLDTMNDAHGLGRVSIGQRGLFIGMEEGFPNPSERYTFQLGIKGPSPISVSGEGIVRWVRTHAKKDEPAGFGLEILSLSPDSTDRWTQILEALNPVSSIPKI